MYGTHRAEEDWQNECTNTLAQLRFVQVYAPACVFCNAGKDIAISVHGDDFTAAGTKQCLDWSEAQMKKQNERTTWADGHQGSNRSQLCHPLDI